MQIETLFFHPTITYMKGNHVITTRATVAGVVNADGDIRFGLSVCSPKDQFSRRRGRELSLSRAKGVLSLGVFPNVNEPGAENTLGKRFARIAHRILTERGLTVLPKKEKIVANPAEPVV